MEVEKSMQEVLSTPTHPSTYGPSPEKCTFSAIWHDAILPYLGTRLVLFIVGLLATFYILPLMINDPILPVHTNYVRFPQALWLMWQHFDSGFYLDIAKNGYWGADTLHTPSDWAFFPLYPWIISWVRWLFGTGSDAYVIAGVLISNIASTIAIGYLYALIFREFGRRAAALTVLYLALFPMSFYLSAVYPEALFLAFAIASIYYARRQSWGLSSLCGGLAALSRSQGVLLIIPIGWEYLRVTTERYAPLPEHYPVTLRTVPNFISTWLITRVRGLSKAGRSAQNWLTGLLLLLIPAGLFVFMVYAKTQTGDLLATFHTENWGWNRKFIFFGRLLLHSLRHPIMNQPFDWNFWLLNIILAFLFLAITVWAFLRLPSIYALYTLVMVLLPLSTNIINSFDRFCVLVFPAYLLLALYTQEKRRGARHFLIGGFAALQAIFMLFFVVGLPAIS
jgi:Dolichyl-phosphate-mannose-protein mannosyltransferase